MVQKGEKKMAEFKSVGACFPVADIGATIQWYEEQLGFIGDPFPPGGPYVFAILRRDGPAIRSTTLFVRQVLGPRP